MPRTLLLGVLFSTAACGGGGDDQGGAKKPELPDLVPTDADQDGFDGDTDCNDGNASIFPGAVEACNGLDDDCNGLVDDDLIETFYRDADRDGFGDAEDAADACVQPLGFVTDSTDCDDHSSAIHPGATEVCDLYGVDEDCNSLVNEDDAGLVGIRNWYVDADEDGFGSDETTQACFEAPGLATVAGDCDDGDHARSPEAVEVCDPDDRDEDCDGLSDIDDPEGPFEQPLYYVDADDDGDGDWSDPGQYFCDGVPRGYSTLGTDCDDTNAIISPQAPENCRDLIDNDCNGAVDDCGPIPDVTLDTADTRLEGATSYAYNGQTVAGVGDMNGDNQADFATGAWQYDSATGAVFLFYGPAPTGTFETEDVIDALIEGTAPNGEFGWSLDKAGDVNSDGFDDLLVGQQFCCSGSSGYLFLGPVLGDTSASSADAVWTGESDDMTGMLIAGDFDFDGDGFDDYAIGAERYDTSSMYSDEGRLFLIYGPGTGSNLVADAPATFSGSVMYEAFGQEATGLPDVDGDGVDDLLVGVQYSDSSAGKAALFYGGSYGGDTLDSEADATITGAATYDYLGARTSRANDFNNDGYGDFLVSAFQADTWSYYTGSIYVILGPADEDGTADTLAQAEFYGEYGYEQIGRAPLDGEMDLNLDGYTDVLIGAPDTSSSTYGTGTAYLFYGPQTGDVSVANARCAMTGTVAGEQSSSGLSFIGDQSGDGSPEVLIGAPYGSSYSGNVYVVLGDRL